MLNVDESRIANREWKIARSLCMGSIEPLAQPPSGPN